MHFLSSTKSSVMCHSNLGMRKYLAHEPHHVITNENETRYKKSDKRHKLESAEIADLLLLAPE